MITELKKRSYVKDGIITVLDLLVKTFDGLDIPHIEISSFYYNDMYHEKVFISGKGLIYRGKILDYKNAKMSLLENIISNFNVNNIKRNIMEILNRDAHNISIINKISEFIKTFRVKPKEIV